MTRFSLDPLFIYVGLAIATLGGLVAISHERWDHSLKSAEQVMGKTKTAAPVQPNPATPTPAPSTAAPGSSTPAVATRSPEVKPAELTQTAATPVASGPAQPAAPEAKSQSPQKSVLEQEPPPASQPGAKPSKVE